MAKESKGSVFDALFIISEIIMIILYATCTEYGDGVHPAAKNTQVVAVPEGLAEQLGDSVSEINDLLKKDAVQQYYPIFQDVHVMIYVGFGFLMVFLKQHSWTSVGYNFIVAAYAAQLTILVVGFWEMLLDSHLDHMHKISLDIPALIIGDFGAGAVLISFGAILGKCSLSQLWCLATLEIIFYGLNEAICAGRI